MQAKTQKETEHLKNALKQLSNFSSWQLIRNELQSTVNDIEQMLFTTDAKKNQKEFTQHDIQRAERKILKMLINLPEDMFEELQDFIEEPEESPE